MNLTRRQKLELRLSELKAARKSWEVAWRSISHQLVPWRVLGLETTAEANRADDQLNEHIINSTPVDALLKLVAFMMAAFTSPAREWLGLSAVSPEARDSAEFSAYLDECKKIMLAVLARSNFYDTLANGGYFDMAGVGTGLTYCEEHVDGAVFTSQPIGTYYLDKNELGEIDTCFRTLRMSVRELVHKFGADACSPGVRDAYKKGQLNTVYSVVHAVLPNDEFQEGVLGPAGFRFASLWWEANDKDPSRFLHVSGYHRFPALVLRWSVRDGDVYGRSPGWIAYRDCRSLQATEYELARLKALVGQPPVAIPEGLEDVSIDPGAIVWVPRGMDGAVKPILSQADMAQSIKVLQEEVERLESRIATTFFISLILALVNDERRQPRTATEVQEMRNESALQLGPLLEAMNSVLRHLVLWLFDTLNRNNVLPLPPPEFQNQDIKVEFQSVVHQAQQGQGLTGLRSLLAELRNLGTARPEVLDKVDFDVVVDELARMLGVPAKVIRSLEQMEQLRAAQAKRQQAQEQGQAMLAATQGVRNLGGTDPASLTELAQTFGPAVAAQAGGVGL